MEKLSRNNLIEREQKKYNMLHSEIKYGGRTGRAKQFFKNNDVFHFMVKKAFKSSKTMLDVGCGKGFFIDCFSTMFKNLSITGCDISEKPAQLRPDLKIITCSADQLPFHDKTFDIVVHMDGMEHIPREIELNVMNELCRVSKKYVYMTIATHRVKHHDDKFEALGLGAVHINMRSAEEWKEWIDLYCKNKCVGFVDYIDWVHVLIEVA